MPPNTNKSDTKADTMNNGGSLNTSNNNNNNNNNNNGSPIATAAALIGPDLNVSRTALDHKLYRQLLLPNGLRCVIIQDTVAMHENGGTIMAPPPAFGEGSGYESEDDDSSSSSSDNKGDTTESEDIPKGKSDEDNDDDNDDDDDDEEDDDNGGLRDAAACLLVGAGSALEPDGFPGLAHALEHFLSMGSEKYPGENEFADYMAKHGGWENACTEWEYTSYSMSIPQDYLFGALDRLAHCAVAPLLQQTSVERELNAVESEFQLNIHDDECRLEQLWCATGRLGHAFTKFAWGNLRSLRDIPAQCGLDLQTEMRQFFNTHYYAANMRLVVMGAYTLDVLQQHVTQIFTPIPALPRCLESNKETLPNGNGEKGTSSSSIHKIREHAVPVNDPNLLTSWDTPYNSPLTQEGPLWDKERSLQKIFYIIPMKERHQLTITWQLPCMFQHWDSKPTDYLSHLLGHEAEGSLLSYLRKKLGWATACSAGLGDDGVENASSHALFSVTYMLSETGLPHWRQVITATYAYIGMLRYYSHNQAWPEWIYDELKQLADVSHQYSDEDSPDELVEDLVEEMNPAYGLPPERLLDGSELFFRFDGEEIRRILDEDLRPENARIDFMSSSFGQYSDFEHMKMPQEGTETLIRDLQIMPASDSGFHPKTAAAMTPPQMEPMFGTLFWCQQVSETWLEEWDRAAAPQQVPSIDVSLPPQNPFVPTRYDLKDLPATDSRHALVNSSIKVCTPVGKKKEWFQATVVRYDRNKNSVLLSYEDEEEQWHKLDQGIDELSREKLKPGFEGTMDKRKSKFRLLLLARIGSGMIRSFGDDDDMDESGRFPAIPPVAPRSRLPKEIASSSLLRMWHLQDRNFHRPIADLRIQFVCQHANSTALMRTVAELLGELVLDVCTETTYLAGVGEIGTYLEPLCIGFNLRFHGFDDKLLDLVRHVLPIFLSFRGTEDSLPDGIPKSRFDACYEILRRKYKNQGLTASKLCRNIRLQALRETYWSSFAKLQALETIDVATFAKNASLLLSSFFTEAFYHGNVTDADAKNAKEMLQSILNDAGATTGLNKKKYPPQSMLKIPMVKTPTQLVVPSKEQHDPNTAVEVYVQVGKDQLRERVLIDLLINMMEEPFFDHVRTKDQFGYEVDCDVRWSYGVMGMVFRVVSSVKSAKDIVARVDQFLLDFRKSLVDMESKEYMEHLIALASHKLEMFNSMEEETDSYWSEISDGRYHWQVWRDEAVCLRSITKDDVLKAFDDWLHPDQKRKIVAVQVVGNGATAASEGRPVVDQTKFGQYALDQVEAFRASCKNQIWGKINSKLF